VRAYGRTCTAMAARRRSSCAIALASRIHAAAGDGGAEAGRARRWCAGWGGGGRASYRVTGRAGAEARPGRRNGKASADNGAAARALARMPMSSSALACRARAACVLRARGGAGPGAGADRWPGGSTVSAVFRAPPRLRTG